MSAALPIRTVAKPWGRDFLPPPFAAPDGSRIGEIWFEPSTALPQLLVKYIFTSEALSVQVHPSDAQTIAAGLGRQGKEECWLIVDAEPGAALGIGFRQPLTGEQMRTAALDGSIEGLLDWHPVRAGDFFYIPANTVHAIGGGISLIEVQQNSDVTYRLYDYGRPRELHLDDGMAVARGESYPVGCRKVLPAKGNFTLVNGPVFRLDRLQDRPEAALAERYGDRPLLVIPRRGVAQIAATTIAVGECGLAARLADLTFDGEVLIAQPA